MEIKTRPDLLIGALTSILMLLNRLQEGSNLLVNDAKVAYSITQLLHYSIVAIWFVFHSSIAIATDFAEAN